jgi:AMP nucleosidase
MSPSEKTLSVFKNAIQGVPKYFDTGKEAVAEIQELYAHSVALVKKRIDQISDQGASDILPEATTYPYAGLIVPRGKLNVDARIAYGAALEAGCYGTTLTRPDIFSHYYEEQIDRLIQHHGTPVFVAKSTWPIPIPFVDESLTPETLWDLNSDFALPDLTKVDDSIANGTSEGEGSPIKPLALFTGERVDYSLHRLHHYCGTAPEHFQNFVLLTNYQRYIDHFIQYGIDQLAENNAYREFVQPGDVVITPDTLKSEKLDELDYPKHLPQMPAYHLKRKDRNGISFVNIGVGPTNTKTITDHIAVLRPHGWIMLGHCAGFRRSQQLGDYVLAHGYVRDDHVLDYDVPPWVPIPPIAEVQMGIQEAVMNVTGLSGMDLKTRIRTGTVVSSDNRNWELGSAKLFQRYNQARAIALDLESATVATNGFRFRVPYGTLLCVSDKPLHGELKLRGMATQFYKERVRQHLEIGLETVRILRERGPELMHSRKLRGFDEPPFR